MQNAHEIKVNHQVIRGLANNWSKRCTIRSQKYPFNADEQYDPNIPDYPHEMVPFWNHPRFESVSEDKKQMLLTWAWIVYNERTIAAEEYVANPAFGLIMHDRFPGCATIDYKNSIQQSLIDEHFHTFMHINGIHRTKVTRNITSAPKFPYSVTYRRLLEAQSKVSDTWEKELLTLTFAIVSEISINAYLDLIADNPTIQPTHRLIAKLHAHDENAHAYLLQEAGKSLYLEMNDKQRRIFLQTLPIALEAFLAHDYSAWEVILDFLKIDGASEILADSRSSSTNTSLSRDYSGLKKMAEELDVVDKLEFDFGN
ncbi:diiron oxygenase [Haliangium ochraceum]|uniref:p-aminobenzoate N-oxygenase AurF n=1 Tax=Haliangium ochraceum (strain DSM 14365 / JCM 11303 / SMP-2) TaxID=502025 RepID=D0LLC6_HALO1|nr:diiron oxygenase [Haliangium ochraceum]ACY18622.1 conserved hypothetical protein [Haliangium ochraceum DSM 14365]